MKPLIFISFLFLSFSSFSQSLTGKWKPVFFSMDTLARGDAKADTLYINTAMLKEQLKNDDNPEQMEKFMRGMLDNMFQKFKETEEEFTADGTNKEIDKGSGRSRNYTFTYDPQTKILIKKSNPGNREQKFLVSWKKDMLVLTSELGEDSGKKGKMEIVYEKL